MDFRLVVVCMVVASGCRHEDAGTQSAGGGGTDAPDDDDDAGLTDPAPEPGSDADADSGAVPDPSPVQEECEAMCAAQALAECERFLGEDFCVSQCIAHQSFPFCEAPGRQMYACWAAAGYECHESADVPVPLDRCLGAVAEFNACASDLACEYGCRAGQQQDCAFSADFDACVATCEEDVEQEDFVADCESRLHIYAACLDREDAAECGGILHGDDHCAREAIDVGGCLADELLTDCEGWCWAAEHLECAPDECVDFCETGIDPDAPCGDELHEMIHCVMFFGDGACLDGILVGAGICERDTDAYRACIGSATGSVDQHAGSHGR